MELCPVELIEVFKTGEKVKTAFLDSRGKACSTEEAVQDHLIGLGYRVQRGEVQFWQAMFAQAFWEEIFDGTGTPNDFNDIPLDLFSGDEFYLSRQERVEAKTSFLESAKLDQYIGKQIAKHGGTFTRIIHNGKRDDLHYREVLASDDVMDFLKTIDPEVFAKIVHRIALNPRENRAGTPDYVAWHWSLLPFPN